MKINKIFESLFKKAFHFYIIHKIIYKIYIRIKLIKVKLFFKFAKAEPAWLRFEMIEFYQQKYSPLPQYGYDPQTLANRGKERAINILNLIPSKIVNTFLELGCWDGMVSYFLQRMGKSTVATDISSKGFDERSLREGVNIIQMDAHQLNFKNETFDVIFSYDTFEHFENPEKVLQEAIRVVKIGGYIFLDIGPLYLSPFGAHIYRQITIPYCHVLFQGNLLQLFAEANELGILDFHLVNGYSVEYFRKLWIRYSARLKKIKYVERSNLSYLDLIGKHASCFKNKTRIFDNLIISKIYVLFQKIR